MLEDSLCNDCENGDKDCNEINLFEFPVLYCMFCKPKLASVKMNFEGLKRDTRQLRQVI